MCDSCFRSGGSRPSSGDASGSIDHTADRTAGCAFSIDAFSRWAAWSASRLIRRKAKSAAMTYRLWRSQRPITSESHFSDAAHIAALFARFRERATAGQTAWASQSLSVPSPPTPDLHKATRISFAEASCFCRTLAYRCQSPSIATPTGPYPSRAFVSGAKCVRMGALRRRRRSGAPRSPCRRSHPPF